MLVLGLGYGFGCWLGLEYGLELVAMKRCRNIYIVREPPKAVQFWTAEKFTTFPKHGSFGKFPFHVAVLLNFLVLNVEHSNQHVEYHDARYDDVENQYDINERSCFTISYNFNIL